MIEFGWANDIAGELWGRFESWGIWGYLSLENVELHRGVTQLVKGLIWAVFALGMWVRAWRRYRIGWPIRWGLLVGMILAAESYSQITHGIYWLGWIHHEVVDWRLIAPLWISLIFTIWCAYRWATVGKDDDDDAL